MNLSGDIHAGITKDWIDSSISVFTKILNTSLEKDCLQPT